MLHAWKMARAVVLTPPSRNLLALMRSERGRHGLGQVYPDPCIIEATWHLLETEPLWSIPDMNRQLVEQATHPERRAAIEAGLLARDPAWRPVLDRQYGTEIADAQQAERGLLRRDLPFNEFRINENWATRLGAKDLLVSFAPGAPGPFGAPVTTIRVPRFLAPDATGDDLPELVDSDARSFSFRIGTVVLRYDRFGLRRL